MEKQTKKYNAAPLGLLGFGMTTVLLNLYNSGIMKELSLVIIAMGIALGGLAQIVAGILEYKKDNTFGGTAFTAYGFFWLSFVIIKLSGPKTGLEATMTDMGYYLLLWGIFTAFMTIGTIKHNTISKLVFGSLTLLFFLLAIGDFAQSTLITNIAGYVGIICGLFAIYDGVAQIVNNEFGEKILPL